ncbi:MAG: two-component regulator propeller domain-containing protein [Caldilineaceae bacterium]
MSSQSTTLTANSPAQPTLLPTPTVTAASPQTQGETPQQQAVAVFATDTPLSEPTATEPPLPTNTETPQPTETPTITPTPSPTPLSLPLPTPPKVTKVQTGWEPLTIGASVTTLGADANGFVWVGTKNSITQQSPNDLQIAWNFAANELGLDDSGIASILGAKDGGVWVGGNGAAYFSGLVWRTFTISDGLASGVVQAIAEDNQRRIWLGASSGLSIWNGASFFTLSRQTGLPNDEITALLSDGPRMWIGTNGGGVFRFENNQLQVFNSDNIGLESNFITALGKLPDGTLLIGSDQGLMTFTGSRAEAVDDVPHNRITSIVNAPLAEVWVGTAGGGLHHYSDGQWSRLVDNGNLPDSNVTALTVDGYGSLWIATADSKLTRYAYALR